MGGGEGFEIEVRKREVVMSAAVQIILNNGFCGCLCCSM
jgi:hypothetical protein